MFFLTLTIYDSLIIAAAKAEGCDVVYSEDLNDGQVVDESAGPAAVLGDQDIRIAVKVRVRNGYSDHPSRIKAEGGLFAAGRNIHSDLQPGIIL